MPEANYVINVIMLRSNLENQVTLEKLGFT